MDRSTQEGLQEAQCNIPALGADAATIEYPIFVAPFKCKIKKITVIPQAALSGDNTNRKDLNVRDKGTAGSGTTAVGNVDMVTGTDFVAFDEFTVFAPAAGSEYTLADGAVLGLQIEDNATSPAFPALIVRVQFYGTA